MYVCVCLCAGGAGGLQGFHSCPIKPIPNLPTTAHSFPRVHNSGPQEGPTSRLPVRGRAEQEAICHTGLNGRNNRERRGK